MNTSSSQLSYLNQAGKKEDSCSGWRKKRINTTNAILHLFGQQIKHSTATNVILHRSRQQNWNNKFTQVKDRSNASDATMHKFRHQIWNGIWKLTQAKDSSNAPNAIMHPLGHIISSRIWRLTRAKNPTSATNASMRVLWQVNWAQMNVHSGDKSYKCNQCGFTSNWGSALRVHLKALRKIARI